MARKRKRRVAATTTTTSSKLAPKEEMAITSLSLSSALPEPPTSKEKSSKETPKEATTTTLGGNKENDEEELNFVILPTKMMIENGISEPPKSQSPINTASCRRKQAKPQRKNGESFRIYRLYKLEASIEYNFLCMSHRK